MKKFFYIVLVLFSGPIGWVVNQLVRLEHPRFLVRFFIKFVFIKKFRVNLVEVEKPINEYKSFLSFFTRKLKLETRPIDWEENTIISPVDAKIIAADDVDDGNLFQAKNKYYSLSDFLLASRISTEIINPIKSGKFINLYLAPRDYHLIHHPFNAEIKQAFYIPSKFHYPVNRFSLTHFEKVFIKNQRLIVHYQASDFFFLAVWIGAFNVGKIKVFFDENFYSAMNGSFHQKKYSSFSAKKAEYAGAFELGSTVIILFPKLAGTCFDFLFQKSQIKMGEALVKITNSSKK